MTLETKDDTIEQFINYLEDVDSVIATRELEYDYLDVSMRVSERGINFTGPRKKGFRFDVVDVRLRTTTDGQEMEFVLTVHDTDD
jgi:predicted Ser/Thr protein kinase